MELSTILTPPTAPLPAARIYVFGASGDLVSKREMRVALAFMGEHGILKPDDHPVILIGSKPYPAKGFLKTFHDGDDQSTPISEKGFEAVKALAHLEDPEAHLMGIDVSNPDSYAQIAQELGDQNAIFYGALPPKVYPDLLKNLHAAGLTKSGTRQVVLEKPFGADLEQARQLKSQIDSDFQPGQVLLIDHFLAYPGTLNMLALRATDEADQALNSGSVERVEVRLLEQIKSNDRPYFRDTGIIKDMVQSHALQLLATFALELPDDPADLQKARLAVIDKISINVDSVQVGQFEGFNDPAQGAPKDAAASEAETLVRFDFTIDNERWKGVPFRVVVAKGVAERRFGLDVHFRKVPEGLAKRFGMPAGESGNLAITVSPNPKIELSKHLFPMDSRIVAEPPHALLIPDALRGVRGLFVSPEEALRAWEITDELYQKQHARLSYQAGAEVDSI